MLFFVFELVLWYILYITCIKDVESLDVSKYCHKQELGITHRTKNHDIRGKIHNCFVSGAIVDEFSSSNSVHSFLSNTNQIWATTPFNSTECKDSFGDVKELDCTDGNKPVDSKVHIPYDQIQALAFEGSNGLDIVLNHIKPAIQESCEFLYNKHKSFALDRGSADIQSCSRNALRSIKCLIYWIVGRILMTVKTARDRSDSRGSSSLDHANKEREECNGLIQNFVSDTLSYWEDLINSGERKPEDVSYPTDECKSPEEYVQRVWSYFNTKTFDNALPDFWELDFKWYDRFSGLKDGECVSDELFGYSDRDFTHLPSILYPKELGSYKSALGNTVFRSMVKLYCDIYSNKLANVKYSKVVIDAFKFVESEQACNDGVNFTVIPQYFEAIVNYDSSDIASYNAVIDRIDHDINDEMALFLDTSHLPYIKNPVDLKSMCKVLSGIDRNEVLELYNKSFDILMLERPENIQKYRNAWKEKNGNITIPLVELKRALLFGDLDEFSNIISYGMNDLFKLKPVQLNFVQNSIVTLCINFLNSLRSLGAYESNYMLVGMESSLVDHGMENMNNSIVHCIVCVLKVYEKCVANCGLFPLGNTFLRSRSLENLVPFDKYSVENASNIKEYINSHANEAFIAEKNITPVNFPQEYMNDAVSPDNVLALKFLVNYYNFNLFGGRLPIDIKVKFKCDDDSYLSSNDLSASILRVPTIYLHHLIKNNKILISRTILDECFKIFLLWANKFKCDMKEMENSLNNLLERNLEDRLFIHILNCIERSILWPFHFDNLEIALSHNLPTFDMGEYTKCGRNTLNKIFMLLNETPDPFTTLTNLIQREDPSHLWEQKLVPVRHFVSALESGDYDLSYGLISNPSSIFTVSRLSIGDINRLENNLKEISKTCLQTNSHPLDYNGTDIKRKIIIYLENLKIIESACDELREQAVKHALISAPDLVFEISNLTRQLASSFSYEESIDTDVKCSIKNLDDIVMEYGLKENVIYSPEDEKRIAKEESCHVLTEDERYALATIIYKSYNENLFGGLLPKTPKIEFVDYIDDLSSLKVEYFSIGEFKILINAVVTDIQLLHIHLLVQMTNLGYLSTKHNIEIDCSTNFNFPFQSAFKAVNQSKMNFLKSKMLPIAREKRLKIKAPKGSYNEDLIKSMQNTVKYKIKSKEDLISMEVEEFVDEVLEGREKIHSKNNLCNQFEEYHTLKSFATHLISSKYITDDVPVKDYDDSIFRIFYPEIMKDIWIEEKLESTKDFLSRKGIRLPDNDAIGRLWYTYLDQRQQEQVAEYITNKSTDSDSLFLILTKSGALDKKGAVEIIRKLLNVSESEESEYENSVAQKSGAVPSRDDQSLNQTPKTTEGVKRPEMHKDKDFNLGTEYEVNNANNVDTSDKDEFSKEMLSVINSVDPKLAECATILSEKLVKEDWIEARNIINSSESSSYLVESAIKLVKVIKKYGLIDEGTYDKISAFLSK